MEIYNLINRMIHRINEINDENEKAFLQIAQKLTCTISSLVHSKKMHRQLKHKMQSLTHDLSFSTTTKKSLLWAKIRKLLLSTNKQL